jgi:hypothetical protein
MGAEGGLAEPAIAFCVREHDEPAVEVRVNFGVFAGREVTPAEIDDLARSLHDELEAFSIVAEHRHEFGGDVEAALHQVVIEVAREYANDDLDALCDRLVETADAWAETCIASRHSDLSEL